MMVMEICSADFSSFLNGSVLQITALATIISSIIITLSYFIGQIISNPKVTVWAKSEIIQLIVSIFSFAFILITINFFCAIDMGDVASLFGISGIPSGTSLYEAAENYLYQTLYFSHQALSAIRYHLQAYTILGQLSSFICDLSTGSIGWGCLFSYSGTSGQPLGAYGVPLGALNVFFNSTMVAYMTTLSFIFVLLFVYKGFVLFLLPFAIFIRSMPYLRSLGSLLIAVAMSFMIIFPMILAIFSLTSNILLKPPEGAMNYLNEDIFPMYGGATAAGTSLAGSFAGAWFFEMIYFPAGSNVPAAIAFAAYAFIAGVFLPTAAMIATIASINYLARLYGEEIDLSRIIQMV